MSVVEILDVIRKTKAKGYEIVCTSNKCYQLFNVSVSLVWDTNTGLLKEVRLTGIDTEGKTRTFRKTLSWSNEGYLQFVSPWEEMT